MGDVRIFLKTRRDVSFKKGLLSAWSISLDSTFNICWYRYGFEKIPQGKKQREILIFWYEFSLFLVFNFFWTLFQVQTNLKSF